MARPRLLNPPGTPVAVTANIHGGGMGMDAGIQESQSDHARLCAQCHACSELVALDDACVGNYKTRA